jgi:hypothetical protein
MRRLTTPLSRFAATLAVSLGLLTPSVSPFTTTATADSVPELFVSQTVYTHCFDSAWAIAVTNADPNYDVELQEFKWNGATWVSTWDSFVTTTDGTGYAYWSHFGPDHAGFYFAQVIVNGQLSNPVSYQVNANC